MCGRSDHSWMVAPNSRMAAIDGPLAATPLPLQVSRCTAASLPAAGVTPHCSPSTLAMPNLYPPTLSSTLVPLAPTPLRSCQAGEYLSNGSCLKCPVNTYQPTAGSNTECLKCPEPSFAHFEGSTACIA